MRQMSLCQDAMQSTRPDFPSSTIPFRVRPEVIRGLTLTILITAMHAALVFALSSMHATSQETASGTHKMASAFVLEMVGADQPVSQAYREGIMSQHQPNPVARPNLLAPSAQHPNGADVDLPQMESTPNPILKRTLNPARHPTTNRSEINHADKKSAASQSRLAAERSISDNPYSIPAAISPAPGGADDVTPPTTRAAYLNNPHPPYPRTSRRLREEGQVLLAVEIDINGHASQAVIKRSSGFDRLDQSALQTVLKWRFVPGKQAGIAKKMWVNIPINFVLD